MRCDFSEKPSEKSLLQRLKFSERTIILSAEWQVQRPGQARVTTLNLIESDIAGNGLVVFFGDFCTIKFNAGQMEEEDVTVLLNCFRYAQEESLQHVFSWNTISQMQRSSREKSV